MTDVTVKPVFCPRCMSKRFSTSTYSIAVFDSEGNPVDPGGSYHCMACGLMWHRPGDMGTRTDTERVTE